MKRLLVDMDNCITDGRMLDYVNEFLNTNYKLEELKDYYFQNLLGNKLEEFYKFVEYKNIYEDAPLIKDSYKVLEKLNKKYELYIVTAYIWDRFKNLDISADNLKNKYNYLSKMLPFIKPNQYIFTTNKNIIKADIAIDDRLDNLKHVNTKILFSAWHNMSITNEELKECGAVRVSSWKEIEKYLEADKK